jgi:hypothetical protein
MSNDRTSSCIGTTSAVGDRGQQRTTESDAHARARLREAVCIISVGCTDDTSGFSAGGISDEPSESIDERSVMMRSTAIAMRAHASSRRSS